MRFKRFNKEESLRQLRNASKRNLNVKKRTMILSIGILILSVIYFTYARYESISGEFTLINANVGEFSGDIQVISYSYDDGSGVVSSHSVPPANNGSYKINNISCSGGDGTWDREKWGVLITNMTGKVKCNLSFTLKTVYEDDVIATVPEIYDGMIPVTIDDSGSSKGKVRVADLNQEWYDYSKSNWANAVVVSNPSSYQTPGTEINMNDIIQMYVWIPRYRYKLWNAENGLSSPQVIEIEFEDLNTAKSTGSTNGTWLTHPAFTFGSTELNGFWIGKFETGYAGASSKAEAEVDAVDASKVIIKPDVYSWRNIKLGNIFDTARDIENQATFGFTSSQIDTHDIKNMEWGAVAYLTNSIYGRYACDKCCIDSGCEVWTNSNNNYKTGYSSDEVDGWNRNIQYLWNDSTYGGNSSTTGNVYGIYDMSGGAFEFVMANVYDSTPFTWYEAYYEFDEPDSKYYDAYTNIGASSSNHQYGHLGDATRETLKINSDIGGWYNDAASMPYPDSSFFIRGGMTGTFDQAGIFSYSSYDSTGYEGNTWRVVITKQDN